MRAVLMDRDEWDTWFRPTVANLAGALDSLVALLDGDAVAERAVQAQLHG
jgi:hypothetical protein